MMLLILRMKVLINYYCHSDSADKNLLAVQSKKIGKIIMYMQCE